MACWLASTGVLLAATAAPAGACGISYEDIYASSDAVFLGTVRESGGDPAKDWDVTIQVQSRYVGDVDDVVHLQGRYDDLCGPARPAPGRVGVVYTRGDRLYWMFDADEVGLPPRGTNTRASADRTRRGAEIAVAIVAGIGVVAAVVIWRRRPRPGPD